jgi:hypothetical protein
MALNPSVMQAVEKLGYRVTVGDVASQAGLEVQVAERDLLALASEAGGHMQVAESGEIAYLFSKNFRDVLRNKYFRLQLQEWWSKIWRVLFYIIRVSFGLVLIASILLIMAAIAIILIAIASGRGDNDSDSGWGGSDRGMGGGMNFWFSPDFFYIFTPNYYDDRVHQRKLRRTEGKMNFLESVFSFLFGDGDPNVELDERRWRSIATTIRNNGGAIAAEQVAPYLDNVDDRSGLEEDYMLPVLSRFNGRPEVSPTGQIVYHFPELQVSAQQQRLQAVGDYLKELPWRFSQASSGQVIAAASLGGVNLVGAIVLGSLLRDGTIAAQLGGLVAFVGGIYGILLAYGIGFLGIPLARYFWIQWRNQRIEKRNLEREERAIALNASNPVLNEKLSFAKQFAAATVIDEKNLAYTTESDLTEQEFLNGDKVDAEWRKRLGQSGSH